MEVLRCPQEGSESSAASSVCLQEVQDVLVSDGSPALVLHTVPALFSGSSSGTTHGRPEQNVSSSSSFRVSLKVLDPPEFRTPSEGPEGPNNSFTDKDKWFLEPNKADVKPGTRRSGVCILFWSAGGVSQQGCGSDCGAAVPRPAPPRSRTWSRNISSGSCLKWLRRIIFQRLSRPGTVCSAFSLGTLACLLVFLASAAASRLLTTAGDAGTSPQLMDVCVFSRSFEPP